MKRYRIGQKKIIACSLLAFSAIVAGAPAVTAFAEESAVPAETAETSELEALRLKKEEAQAAYDAALNDKLLAEDVVENAKRAVNDAQEEYDRVLEQYSTGFAGFLRWVMETETDPVKVEDARQVLETSFEDGTVVDPSDPANLTRMLYMADWLEDYGIFFRTVYGIEAGASHAAMRLTQLGFDRSKDLIRVRYENRPSWEEYHINAFYEIDEMLENEVIRSTKNPDYNYISGVWNVDTKMSAVENEGLPLLDGLTNTMNVTGFGAFQRNIIGYGRYRPKTNPPYNNLKDFRKETDPADDYADYIDFFEDYLSFVDGSVGFTIGEALGVDPATGQNFSLGTIYIGEGTYTIEEYVKAIREYYSITDPVAAKSVLENKNDDLDKAGKDLAGAEESLLTAYGRLKGAENEYEEAVAGFAGQTENPTEEAGAALEVVHAVQEAVAAEQADHANVLNGSQNTAATELSSDEYEISTTQDSAAAAVVSYADPAGISPEAEATGQDVSADATFSEQISPESSVVSEQMEPENEAVDTYSAAERQPEETVTANVPDKVNRVTGAVDNSEINKADSAAAVTVSEETEENQDISIEKDKQKNGLLAEVLSYIFNGGAIAFILPAGFKRRKRNKSTGGILQGDF